MNYVACGLWMPKLEQNKLILGWNYIKKNFCASIREVRIKVTTILRMKVTTILIIHLINKQASNAGFIEEKYIILGSKLRMWKGTRTKATISISFWNKNAFKLFLTSNIMREKQSKLQSLANLNILLQKKCNPANTC